MFQKDTLHHNIIQTEQGGIQELTIACLFWEQMM